MGYPIFQISVHLHFFRFSYGQKEQAIVSQMLTVIFFVVLSPLIVFWVSLRSARVVQLPGRRLEHHAF